MPEEHFCFLDGHGSIKLQENRECVGRDHFDRIELISIERLKRIAGVSGSVRHMHRPRIDAAGDVNRPHHLHLGQCRSCDEQKRNCQLNLPRRMSHCFLLVNLKSLYSHRII